MTSEQNSQNPSNNTVQNGVAPLDIQRAGQGELFKTTGVEAQNPLDFITKNVRNGVLQAPPKEVVATPSVQASPEPTIGGEVKMPEAPKEQPKEEVEEFPEISDPKNPAAVNWTKLRSAHKAEREEHKKTREQLESIQTEVEEYRSGKKLSDTLESKENEIARLRGYEEIVSLKTSPEYQERYVKPLTDTSERLRQLCTDYEVPEEVFSQVRGLKNEAQVNGFLDRHFDTVGALEIKNLLREERRLSGEMVAAENKPKESFERLLQEGQAARLARQKQEREVIQVGFREAWKKSLTEIREQGTFSELIYRENDSAHNEKVVTPIIQKAAGEAGKLLTMLVEDGLTKLRPEVASFISKMSVLAHSSAVNAQTRELAVAHFQEIEKNTTRTNSIARPSIGGSTGAAGAGVPKERERLTADSMAQQLSARISGQK